MTETFSITVDGREAPAAKGEMLLDVIRGVGISLPTLCHHPSLEPTGACRLCVVEISHADWKGWSGLVTSCLYPVEPGLQVLTRSDRIRAVRRTLFEMLLARCPGSEVVREMAAAEGVSETPFPVRDMESADKCVMCGLCVRVCQDLGPAAIAPLGRGADKEVGPRPDGVGEDCTGCGACALVCPTDEIETTHRTGTLNIWNREFPLPICSVAGDRCRACGVCEEVCPLAIPRVSLFSTGSSASRPAASAARPAAVIAAHVCTGCGLCAGACPTGAIDQDTSVCPESLAGFSTARDLKGRVPVYACSRSSFPQGNDDFIPVPCVGRVTVEDLLENLARRADGVLVLGRDKETCPSGPGEDQAEARVKVADELAGLAGLGRDRIRFVIPGYGYDGPPKAYAAFRENGRPSLIEKPLLAGEFDGFGPLAAGIGCPAGGMDRIFEIVHALWKEPGIEPVLPATITDLFAGKEDTLIYLGDLLVLDLVLSLLVKGKPIGDLIRDAAVLLDEKGISARPVVTPRMVEESKASRVIAFCECCLPDFGRPVDLVTLDKLAGVEGEGIPAMGGPFRFRISPEERIDLLKSFHAADGGTCSCPSLLAQFALLDREGAWRPGLIPEPTMAFQKAVRTAGEAVS